MQSGQLPYPARHLRQPPALAQPLRLSGCRTRSQRDAARLWARALALVHAPQRLELTIAMTAARFARCRGAGWLAEQNDSDYAREHLGIARTTFDTWVRVGHLAMQLPEAARGVVSGVLTVSALAELTRLRDADAARGLLPLAVGAPSRHVRVLVDQLLHPPAPGPPDVPGQCAHATGVDCERRAVRLDPQLEGVLARWEPRVPVPIAAYFHQTLGVARLVLGHDAPPHELLEAVVGEASADIELTVAAEEASQRLGLRLLHGAGRTPTRAPAPPPSASLTEARLGVWARGPGGAVPPPRAIWKLAREHPSRALAHRLDRRLKRLQLQRRALTTHLEDELLVLLEVDAPHRLGYRSFEQFVEEGLGMRARTAWDRIARARRRRRNDLLALALGVGRIAEAHGTELERLVRRAYVPRSALGPWIEVATTITVRKLRRMVDWAIGRFYDDYRSWSSDGFPPPSDEELRTSGQRLMQGVATPEPPSEATLLQADRLPHVRVPLVANAEMLVLLAQMIASLQDLAQRRRDRLTGDRGARPPEWWGLLTVLTLARRPWAELALCNTHDTHCVLERDAYRCAAPGCGRLSNLEAHHIRYRSDQGSDDMENLATLCTFHHRLGEHGGILRVRGRAIPDAGALIWAMGLDEHGRARRLYQGDTLLRADDVAGTCDS